MSFKSRAEGLSISQDTKPVDNLPSKEELRESFRPIKREEHYLTFEEEEAEWLFNDEHILTREEFDTKIVQIFNQVCGEHGKLEFFEIVVPKIKQVYGANLRKAGMRLLNEIDHGASLKPAEIGEYFKNAVSPEEIEFSKKSKEAVAQEIYIEITDLIEEERKRFGTKYPIKGAFIYGSFPKNNFNLRSDIDCVWLVNGKELGVYVKKDERYINLIERLEKLIEARTGFEVQRNFILPMVNVTSRSGLRDFSEIIREQFFAEKSAYVLIGLSEGEKAEIEKLVEEAK